MILIGELSLWVAILMTAWAATTSFAGGYLKRDDLIVSGQRAVYATFALTALAAIGLWTALLTHDFSLAYVAGHISANMEPIYIFVSFWSGQQGSMLLWALILSMYSAIAVYTSRERNRAMVPFVAGTLASVLLFFLACTAFKANPFIRLDWVPPDGKGMNPQLMNPGMALHPPNLYLGYVGTTIPFAFAVGALMVRKLDSEWLAAVRRWSLLSWFFLTIGIVLGMWWAYVELGWGGYWMWDPVENASFLPWLTQTAFLHSIMIQEKRGMLRKWNVVLVVATFLLSVFGTFITRSGIVESVHSFAQSPVSVWFSTFFVVSTGATIYLVATRLRDLEAKVELESMISREAAFLYNNLVLCCIAFAVLWGTLFPIISEFFVNNKITVGAPVFNAVNVPLGMLLLALTGIGPLIAWRKASSANLRRQFLVPALAGLAVGVVLFVAGIHRLAPLMTFMLCGFVAGTIFQEFQKGIGARRSIHGEAFVPAFMHLVARNRRRYGGYIVHAGIVMLFAAFAGGAFRSEHDFTLRTTEEASSTDQFGRVWRFQSEGLSNNKIGNRVTRRISLNVWRDGKPVRPMGSEKRAYFDSQGNALFGGEESTEVDILSSARMDTYLVFAGAIPDGPGGSVTSDSPVNFRVSFIPLVIWVWIGGVVMMIGGMIVMWPQTERRRPQAGYVTVIPSREPVREPALVG